MVQARPQRTKHVTSGQIVQLSAAFRASASGDVMGLLGAKMHAQRQSSIPREVHHSNDLRGDVAVCTIT